MGSEEQGMRGGFGDSGRAGAGDIINDVLNNGGFDLEFDDMGPLLDVSSLDFQGKPFKKLIIFLQFLGQFYVWNEIAGPQL